jgi:predicted ribosomally synthesized peptide with SipW-like signal peptide
MTDEFELSRRRTLAALGTVGAASAGAGVGTSAFFSDTESFENNALTAGELDLGVGYTARYSDWSADEGDGVSVRPYDGPAGTTGDAADLGPGETGLPTGDDWLVAVDDPEGFLANTETGSFPTADGDDANPVSCADLPQADDAARPVIDLDDVKPGDFGTVTLDFALCDNPGYVWVNGTLRDASENGTTEPEADDADEVEGVVELLDVVQAAVWVDDGDGYVDGETTTISGSLRAVLDELETGPGLALGGDVDEGLGRNCFSADGDGDGSVDVHHVSLAWWVPVDHGNEIQSDSVTFDLGLYTEQCRHNEGAGVDLEAVVSTPEVQQLLTDLGHPSPAATDADDFGSAGPVPLDFDQTRTRRLPVEEQLSEDRLPTPVPDIYRTHVPSPLGGLDVVSIDGRGIVTAAFSFDRGVPASIRNELALAGDVDWPAEVRASVLANGEETVFARGVSDDERAAVGRSLDLDPDSILAFSDPGESAYIATATPESSPVLRPDSADSGRLLTDGGAVDCGAAPSFLCDASEPGITAVLGPEFDVRDVSTDEDLVGSLTGSASATGASATSADVGQSAAGAGCEQGPLVSCLFSALSDVAAFAPPFLEACMRSGIELYDRTEGKISLIGSFYLIFCPIVVGVTVLLTALTFPIYQCVVPRLDCFVRSPTDPAPSPLPEPAFETSTQGDADATVVSEDLSGGGEIDLRTFRCGNARAAVVYGDIDTTLAISFDFEIRRTDAFGEDSYFQVYEDGDVVAETGRNLSIIQPTSEITGRVTKTVDVDGDVYLEFGIQPSDFCRNFDHADTRFTASNLSVERGGSPTPVSGEFETSTTGDADATVVSGDLSGGGELDFRVYRCSSAQAVVPLGNLDGTLSLSFDFESRRNDDFWELPYVRVVVDDAIVFDGRQELELAPTRNDRGNFGNPRTGTVDESIPVDGFVTLVFGIEPSDPCSNADHEDTFFTVSNLSAGLE